MVDFKQELDRLLSLESKPLPGDDLVEAALAGKKILASLNKKQSDIALQVEEIYDIVGNIETNTLQESLLSEKKRADALAEAAVALSDILEDFCAYAAASGDGELARQARIMWDNAGALLERSGFVRLGIEGQTLDPSVHAVQAAEPSAYPKEQISRVLQSGFRYRGNLVRKAAVAVSSGQLPPEPETEEVPARPSPSELFRLRITICCLPRKEEKKKRKEKTKKAGLLGMFRRR